MGYTDETLADSTASDSTAPESTATTSTTASATSVQVEIIDLLVMLARKRRLIAVIVSVFLVGGILLSLISQQTFVAEAKVVRESQADMPGIGGLGGGISALQGLGINLGGSMTSGLTSQAYASVLESREVRLAIARDTFYFPDMGRSMTMIEYSQRPTGFVRRILDYARSLPSAAFGAGRADSIQVGERGITLSVAELEAVLRYVGETISSRTDQQSGLMTISASTNSPQMSAAVNRSAIRHLTERVREIRTRQTRERLAFVENRFAEVQAELSEAEESLADFLQSNQNPTTATLRFQRDRLQRQVSFKEQLYTELQGQLTQVRLELQRSQPVVTVVEEPVPPVEPASPNYPLNVLISLVLGFIAAVGAAFVVSFLSPDTTNDDEYERKIEIVREALFPEKIASKMESLADRFRST